MVPEGTSIYAEGESRATMRIMRSGMVEFVLSGRITVPLCDAMIGRIERTNNFVIGDIIAFHDWSGVGSYESAARLRLTTWLWKNRDRFRAVHILTTDRLVSMGVTVANGTLGGFLTTYATMDQYRQARDAMD